jgi:hypothetical protein
MYGGKSLWVPKFLGMEIGSLLDDSFLRAFEHAEVFRYIISFISRQVTMDSLWFPGTKSASDSGFLGTGTGTQFLRMKNSIPDL